MALQLKEPGWEERDLALALALLRLLYLILARLCEESSPAQWLQSLLFSHFFWIMRSVCSRCSSACVE